MRALQKDDYLKFWDWLSGLRDLRVGREPEHDERRRLPRLRCYYRIKVRSSGYPHPLEAYVVEINSQGLRFHLKQSLPIGQHIELIYDSGKSISSMFVEVVWSQTRTTGQTLIGCLFDTQKDLSQTWAGHILEQLGFPSSNVLESLPPRQTIRYPAEIPAVAHCSDTSWKVTTVDIGAGGALVETSEPLPEDVTLEFFNPPGFKGRMRLVSKRLASRPSGKHNGTLCHLQWVYLTPQETRDLGKVLFAVLKSRSD